MSTFEIPDGWQQGRGAFGGLVLGAAVRASEAFLGVADRPLRTVSGHICAPVLVGEAEIHVSNVRAGSGVTTTQALITQNSETLVHVVCVFGRRRVDDGDWLELPKPEMPDWRTMEPLPLNPFSPTFTQHIEYRTNGPLPFSGQSGGLEGFVRERKPSPHRDRAQVITLVDAWWPVAVSRMSTPRPTATLTFTAQIFSDLTHVPLDEPVFHRAQADVAEGGYTAERRELWSLDGRLLVLNQQTFTIIK